MSKKKLTHQEHPLPENAEELKKVLAALREREAHYRQFFENAPDVIWKMNTSQNKLTYVSPLAQKLLGYTPEELLAMPESRVLTPDSFALIKERITARVSRLKSQESEPLICIDEVDQLRKDGSIVHTEVTTSYLRNNLGEVEVIGVSRDISARKQAEKELADSEKRYRTLFEQTHDAVFLLDLNGKHLAANQRAAEMLGYTLEEIQTLSLRDTSAEISKSEQVIQKLLKGEHIPIYERVFRRKDGSLLLVEINAELVRDVDNKPIYIQSVVRDITERKQAEEALSKSEALLAEAQCVGKLGHAEWVAYRDEVICSDETLHLFGLPPDSHTISRKAINARLHPEDHQRLEELDRQAFAERAGLDYEYRILLPDNQSQWIHQTAQISYAEDGKPTRMLVVFQNITERKQAEEALKASEERYRTLVENMKDIVMEVDAQGNFCYVSPNYEALSGYSLEEKLGHPGFAHVHPEDLPMLLERMGQALISEQSMVYRVQTKSSEWRWIETSGKPYRTEDGSLHIIRVARDITERRRAEETIRRTERRANALIENAPDGVALVGVDGKYKYGSPAGWKMFGYDEDMARLDPLELTHPEDRPYILATLNDLIQNPSQVPTIQYRFRHNDGSWRWIESTFSNLVAEPSIEAIVINFRDITEHKLAEEALQASEEKYRRLFENASLGIFQSTPEGKAISVNAAFARMFGYDSPTDALEHIKNVATDVFADPNRRTELIRFMAENPGLRTFENLYRRKDGSTFIGSLNSMPIKDVNGNLIRIEGIIEDITERKQAEEAIRTYSERLEQEVAARSRELQDAQEKLVRQEKLAVLGQLAGGVGHELRSPLSVINNAIYLLRLLQADANPQVREYLGIIDQETHNAEKIISDLLEFSHTKSVDQERVPVKELLQTVFERFPAPENIAVIFNIPTDLPPVFADPRHLKQVFGNLIVNACQAMALTDAAGEMQGGTLTLSAKKKGEEIAIAVTDTGMGISAENMAKLFEPLFTTKAKGIGLGLAVSKRLMEANGGRIEVQSEPGRGSIFTSYLPIHQEIE
jgi:PAS domain S-box-containing protein